MMRYPVAVYWESLMQREEPTEMCKVLHLK
jgi:hypothetical protein